MTEFLYDNPDREMPPIMKEFFYDAANLVVGSIGSGRLPEELANTTPRSYGVVAQPKDTDKQGVLYYLNFRRGVGHNVWGECDIELNIVEISDDNNRVALNILPDGKAKAKSLYTDREGLLKSGPSSLGAGEAEEFLARFYDEDGAFRLEAVPSIPEDLNEHLCHAQKVVAKMSTINTPKELNEEESLRNRILFFVSRLLTTGPDEDMIPVPAENTARPAFDDGWLMERLEVFSNSKELVSAITKAFTAYKNDNTPDENGDTIEKSRGGEGLIIKAGGKYWSLNIYMGFSVEPDCVLEEIPVGDVEASVIYKLNGSSGSLRRTEIVPGQNAYINDINEAMAIATELEFIAKPGIGSNAPDYSINREVTPLGDSELPEVLRRYCIHKQKVYRTPCHCSTKH